MEVNPYESPREADSAPLAEPERDVAPVRGELLILLITAFLVALAIPAVVLFLLFCAIVG